MKLDFNSTTLIWKCIDWCFTMESFQKCLLNFCLFSQEYWLMETPSTQTILLGKIYNLYLFFFKKKKTKKTKPYLNSWFPSGTTLTGLTRRFSHECRTCSFIHLFQVFNIIEYFLVSTSWSMLDIVQRSNFACNIQINFSIFNLQIWYSEGEKEKSALSGHKVH